MKSFHAAALAVFALTVSVALPAAARTVMADPPDSPAALAEAATPTWWLGFNEAALDRLQAVAQASTGSWNAARQAELATTYVTLRVQNLRLQNAAELRVATGKERELLAGRSPTREASQLLAALDERAAVADRAIAEFARQREDAVRRLLQLTSADAEAAKAAIASALDDHKLPEFRSAVPQRLPAVVLLSRPDVAEVERKLAAHSSMSLLLSGWIGPAAGPAPLALPGGDEAGADDTLRQAGREVSWSLRQLIDASASAGRDARRLEARRLEMLAMQSRVEAGDADPAQLLEAYQQFLAEADTLAQAQGLLALAWIALHAQAPGSLSALARGSAP